MIRKFAGDHLFGDLLAFDIQHQLNVVLEGFVGFRPAAFVGLCMLSGGLCRADRRVEQVG